MFWKDSATLLLMLLILILLSGCATQASSRTIPEWPDAGEQVAQELGLACGVHMEACPASKSWLTRLFIFKLQLDEAR